MLDNRFKPKLIYAFRWQPYENFDKANEALMAFELKNASVEAESTDDEIDN